MKLKTLISAFILSSGFLAFPAGSDLFAAGALDTLSAFTSPIPAPVPLPGPPAPFPGPLKPAPALHAYFVNVGQGDAQYIELPNGKNVLIDGGPNPTAPLIQFLSENKVTKLDYVVLTHPHLDHYAGLDYVFTHLKVGTFYDTREENTGAAGSKVLRNKISAMGINTVYPAAGDSLDWDPAVQVNVFNACATPGGSASGPVLNNCSIVFKVTYQDTSILYTGDIESDQEENLIAAYGGRMQSQVLKVCHHGSNTSTSPSFLNTVKPKYAYIGVGRDNIFGFPSPVTLSNLQAAGVTVYRTDLDGTQQFNIGGR